MYKKYLVQSFNSNLNLFFSSYYSFLPRFNLFFFFALLFLSSCISDNYVDSITFEDIKDIKIGQSKNGEKILNANIVLKNENKINFILEDFNLNFYWKDEVFEVQLNDEIKNVKFGEKQELIPVKAKIPANLLDKNLLSIAFEALTGKKQEIQAKGTVSLKKFIFRKKIKIDETLSVGL